MVFDSTCHSIVLPELPVQGLRGWYYTCNWVDAETLLWDTAICHLPIGSYKETHSSNALIKQWICNK